MPPNRRCVLEATAAMATTSLVGLAGWPAAATGDVDDDLPAYSRWLTLEETAAFSHVDWASIGDEVEAELEDAVDDEETVPAAYEDDPMVAPASEALLSMYLTVSLELAPYRLGTLLEADAFESTVESLLRTDDALVVTGAFVPAEIDDELTAETDVGFLRRMERTDGIDSYDVYTPVDPDHEAAIALEADALVFVDGEDVTDDPTTVLERTIGTAAGDLERATDDETVAWLLETAGHGDVAVGQYGGPFDDDALVHPSFDALGDVTGIVSSLSVEDDETATGDTAAIVADPDEETLETVLGDSADERSVDVDDDRVTATATWYALE